MANIDALDLCAVSMNVCVRVFVRPSVCLCGRKGGERERVGERG